MTKEKSSEALGDLPESIEDITQNPILKPLLDYNKASTLLEKEDESESGYLKEKTDILNEILKTGIYENSPIAKTYSDVLEVYKRLLFIFTRYTAMADKHLGEVRTIVTKYYISKEEHEKKTKGINELKESNKDLSKENKNLKDEIQHLIKPKKTEAVSKEEQKKRLKEMVNG